MYTNSEFKNNKEFSILCHDGMLLVRHDGRTDVPFIELDKDTLKPITEARPFTSENDLLSWTPHEDFSSNDKLGTRAMRHAQFHSDGEYIYCLVRHYSTRILEGLIRFTIEKYTLKDRHFTRIQEIELLDG